MPTLLAPGLATIEGLREIVGAIAIVLGLLLLGFLDARRERRPARGGSEPGEGVLLGPGFRRKQDPPAATDLAPRPPAGIASPPVGVVSDAATDGSPVLEAPTGEPLPGEPAPADAPPPAVHLPAESRDERPLFARPDFEVSVEPADPDAPSDARGRPQPAASEARSLDEPGIGLAVEYVTLWYRSGRRQESGEVWNGERHGNWTAWYASGGRRWEGRYRHGRRHGSWRFWDIRGRLLEDRVYADGAELARRRPGMRRVVHATDPVAAARLEQRGRS